MFTIKAAKTHANKNTNSKTSENTGLKLIMDCKILSLTLLKLNDQK
jgi:hypothetical protein